jgi:hypothetical protein
MISGILKECAYTGLAASVGYAAVSLTALNPIVGAVFGGTFMVTRAIIKSAQDNRIQTIFKTIAQAGVAGCAACCAAGAPLKGVAVLAAAGVTAGALYSLGSIAVFAALIYALVKSEG